MKLITKNKGDVESPSSVMASCKGRSLITMAESDRMDELQMDILKRIIGGDKVNARMMRQNGTSFNFTTTILFVSIFPLKTDSFGYAISERARICKLSNNSSMSQIHQ